MPSRAVKAVLKGGSVAAALGGLAVTFASPATVVHAQAEKTAAGTAPAQAQAADVAEDVAHFMEHFGRTASP